MSLLVAATKLFYPFDDKKRYPNSLNDPAAQIMDWEAWAALQHEYYSRGKRSARLEKGFEVEVNEEDVLQMTPVQMDDYIDWYGKIWIGSGKGTI